MHVLSVSIFLLADTTCCTGISHRVDAIHHLLWIQDISKPVTVAMIKSVPDYQIETQCLLRLYGPWGSRAESSIVDMLADPTSSEAELLRELRSLFHQSHLTAYNCYLDSMVMQSRFDKVCPFLPAFLNDIIDTEIGISYTCAPGATSARI